MDMAQRLVWSINNQNKDLSKTIYMDETTLRVLDLPLYHVREKGSVPERIPNTGKIRHKLNVCGGISYAGPTEFAVSQ
jgi:hypothetical protein